MKQNTFPLVMKSVAAITGVVTVVLTALYHIYRQDWILSAAISTGTTFYHFAMRLAVGTIVPHFVKDPMRRRWFRQKAFEQELYQKLRVKQWKDHMPTYNPASFSLQSNTMEQIVHNSCVSEAVHVVIVLFTFVPIFFTYFWGALPVFLITSVLAALFDSCFVVMQRYNRPRLVRILEKRNAK